MSKMYFALIPKSFGLMLICILFAIFQVSFASAQTTIVKVQPSTASPSVDSTFTVDITISNVQNLYGVDVFLHWDPSVLKVLTATSFLGVESNAGGVLHRNITVVEEGASIGGTYDLVAHSEFPAPSFNGSGKIATLSFSVLRAGHSDLTLETELGDKPSAVGGTPNPIGHSDSSSAVDALVPEFSTVLAVIVFLVLASSVLVFAKKRMEKSPSLGSALG